MTIRDAENEWLMQQSNTNRKKREDDVELNPVNTSDSNKQAKMVTSQIIDSGFSGSNKSDNSDYEKLSKSNENINLGVQQQNDERCTKNSSPISDHSSHSNSNNNNSSNNNNGRANSRIKIVSTNNLIRSSLNPNLGSQKSVSVQNISSNSNNPPSGNSMSSSSSSSLVSNEKDSDYKDAKVALSSVNNLNDDDYNYVPYVQRQSIITNSRANSRSNSATSYARNVQVAKQNSSNYISSTNNQTSNYNLNSNNNNTNNNNNNTNNNVKRSISLNGGSNIHEENTMFFYGNKSLDITDIKLDTSIINQVLTISFHYIDYDDFLSKCFTRIRNKFPNVNVS